jgi:signal transduction histidine kinase
MLYKISQFLKTISITIFFCYTIQIQAQVDLSWNKLKTDQSIQPFDSKEIPSIGCKFSKNSNAFHYSEKCNSWSVSPDFDLSLKAYASVMQTFPDAWKEENRNQYAIYTLDVSKSHHKAIKLGLIHLAYRLWKIQGKDWTLIEVSGLPSPNPSNEIPLRSRKWVSYGEADFLVLEVSNHFDVTGGVLASPVIGSIEEIRDQFFYNIALDYFAAGASLLIGIYHIFLYFLRRRMLLALWLGLSGVFISLRILATSHIYAYLSLNLIPYDVVLKLEFFTVTAGWMLFNLYLYELLNRNIIVIWFKLNLISGFLISLSFLFLGPTTMSQMIPIIVLFLGIHILQIQFELIRKSFSIDRNVRINARLLYMVYFIYSGFVIHDALIYLRIIQGQDIVGIGFIIFITGQGMILARINSQAWSNSDYLSEKLKEEVEIRTDELKIAKLKAETSYHNLLDTQHALSRAERDASLTQVSAHLAHEVNNPLNFIKIGNDSIFETSQELKKKLYHLLDESDESKNFQTYLDATFMELSKSYEMISDGVKRISENVQEIRGVTFVDGNVIHNANVFELIKKSEKQILSKYKWKSEEWTMNINCININYSDFEKLNIKLNPFVFSMVLRTILDWMIRKSQPTSKYLINCNIKILDKDNRKFLFIEINIPNKNLSPQEVGEIFSLHTKTKEFGELINLGLAKEMMKKVNGMLILTDDGRLNKGISLEVMFPE